MKVATFLFTGLGYDPVVALGWMGTEQVTVLAVLAVV